MGEGGKNTYGNFRNFFSRVSEGGGDRRGGDYDHQRVHHQEARQGRASSRIKMGLTLSPPAPPFLG